MKPIYLPAADSFAHGTRARYVAKCRCDECRAANTQYARERAELAKERAAELDAGDAAPSPAPQVWTRPDGTKATRVYARLCRGVHGRPCPTRTHLRKDSTGEVCGECRLQLTWNGMVPADRARVHLLALSAVGVGRDAVNAACDVAVTVLSEVFRGAKAKIRAETERRILRVDAGAAADHAIIDATDTWRLLDELLLLGFRRGELAQRLGCKSPALQLRRERVLARTALRVTRLHAEVITDLRHRAEVREMFAAAGEGASEYFKDGFAFYFRKSAAAAPPEHGTPKAFSAGCRCAKCVASVRSRSAKYSRESRERKKLQLAALLAREFNTAARERKGPRT